MLAFCQSRCGNFWKQKYTGVITAKVFNINEMMGIKNKHKIKKIIEWMVFSTSILFIFCSLMNLTLINENNSNVRKIKLRRLKDTIKIKRKFGMWNKNHSAVKEGLKTFSACLSHFFKNLISVNRIFSSVADDFSF